VFRTDNLEKSRGQSLVELALILPIAVLLLALSADFARAMTAYIQVGSAAREGAAYGMQSTEAAADQAGMRTAAQAETPSIWGDPINVTFPGCTDTQNQPSGSPYDCIAVTVNYNFRPFITVGPIPSSIPMQRTVEMRVVN
jgi:Flp pilus assembly protein TadG